MFSCLLGVWALLPALQAEEGVIRVACVGDSITEGTLLLDRPQNAYPAQLAKLLGKGYDVQNFGKSGATVSQEGPGALPYDKLPQYQEVLVYAPDIILIMLGTNDAKTPIWSSQKERFSTAYESLIKRFVSLPKTPRIILCRPVPVLGEGRFGINEENRREILLILDKLAKDQKLQLLDFDPALRDRKEFYHDPVHPNIQGTWVIAQTIAERVLNLPSPSAL